jgi:hypothetical protein
MSRAVQGYKLPAEAAQLSKRLEMEMQHFPPLNAAAAIDFLFHFIQHSVCFWEGVPNYPRFFIDLSDYVQVLEVFEEHFKLSPSDVTSYMQNSLFLVEKLWVWIVSYVHVALQRDAHFLRVLPPTLRILRSVLTLLAAPGFRALEVAGKMKHVERSVGALLRLVLYALNRNKNRYGITSDLEE